MKKNRHKITDRRQQIKNMLHQLQNDDCKRLDERLNDLYHGAKQKFLDKGNDPETATKKAFGLIMDILPDDCAAKIDKDGNLIIVNIKDNKNE